MIYNKASLALLGLLSASLCQAQEVCPISAEVKCFIEDTNEPCETLLETDFEDNCGDRDLRLHYKYCNDRDNITVRPNWNTITTAYNGANIIAGKGLEFTWDSTGDLQPSGCSEGIFRFTQNNCEKKFVTGKLSFYGNPLPVKSPPKDVCYAWNWYHQQIANFGDQPIPFDKKVPCTTRPTKLELMYSPRTCAEDDNEQDITRNLRGLKKDKNVAKKQKETKEKDNTKDKSNSKDKSKNKKQSSVCVDHTTSSPTGNVNINVLNKKGEPIWSETDLGNEAVISLGDGISKMDSEITLEVFDNNVVYQTVTMHISCSKPFNVYDTFGSFTVSSMSPIEIED